MASTNGKKIEQRKILDSDMCIVNQLIIMWNKHLGGERKQRANLGLQWEEIVETIVTKFSSCMQWVKISI